MRKTIFTLLLGLTAAVAPARTATPSDTLNYQVAYKWGFINKTAGTGTIITRTDGDTISASLEGHSIPWGGRIYSVKDSLVATLIYKGDEGEPSERVIYENGTYTKPRVTVGPNGKKTIQRNYAYKNIDGEGTLDASSETMQAVTISADMLSLFKWGSILNFDGMQPGQITDIDITGANPGRLEVRYVGRSIVSLKGINVPAYEIVFTFEYEGVMSAYPVTAWIGIDKRIPLKFSADIKIGHVEMALE